MHALGTFQFNIWALLLTFAALQGLFLFFLLLTDKRGDSMTNRVVAALVLALALLLVDHGLRLSGFFTRVPHLIFVLTPLWYLLPVLFYFYVKAHVAAPLRFRWKDALHLAPLLYAWLNYAPFYLSPAARKLEIFSGVWALPAPSLRVQIFQVFSSFFYMIQIAAYLLVCNRMLKRYELRYKSSNSNPARGVHLEGLKHAFMVFNLYAVYEIAAGVYLLARADAYDEVVFLSLCILSAFIFLIAYNSVRRPEKLFSAPSPSTDAQAEVFALGNEALWESEVSIDGNGINGSKAKYQRYAELPFDPDATLSELSAIMEKHRLYRNSELKLKDLSSKLSLSTHQLSQLLNQEMGLNFYDFVNQYRVKETLTRLADPASRNLTILSIALDAGFNSHASFYRIFKKATGMTPTVYIQSRHGEQALEV